MSNSTENTEVQGSSLKLSFGTSIAAIVTPLGATLAAVLTPLKGQPDAIVIAFLATIAVGVFAAALVAGADALARAWVTVSANNAKIHSTAVQTEEAIKIRVPHIHGEPVPVISTRWNGINKKTWYLVKEPGVAPKWIHEKDVEN